MGIFTSHPVQAAAWRLDLTSRVLIQYAKPGTILRLFNKHGMNLLQFSIHNAAQMACVFEFRKVQQEPVGGFNLRSFHPLERRRSGHVWQPIPGRMTRISRSSRETP